MKLKKFWIYFLGTKITIRLITITILLVVAFIIYSKQTKFPVIVSGASMQPTFFNGEKLWYENNDLNTIKRGDIIVFRKDGAIYIKRVILVENDYYLESTKEPIMFYADGYSYKQENALINKFDYIKLAVPKGFVFVQGDNRENSYDSTYYGVINVHTIIGKIVK